jgi:hypothetical protein
MNVLDQFDVWDVLLRHFHGFSFASSTTFAGGDGGAEGGGDAGDAGGGAGGDEGGDEAIGTGDEGGEGGEGEGEGEIEGEGTEGEGEGEGEGAGAARTKPSTPEAIAKAAEKALSKLRESDPENAAILRKEHFQNRDFRTSFPTPQEARQAREIIDDIGGVSGYAKIQEELGAYATELTRFSDGDPQAVDDFARDYPKGLAKLTPLAVAKMKSIDPPGFERMLSRETAGMMFEKGFTHSVDRVIELIQDGKQEQAFKLAKEMRDWISNVEKFGKSAPAAAGEGELTEVQKREQSVAQREADIRQREINNSVTTSMDRIIQRSLNPLLKGRNLTLAQKQDLAKGIYTHISETLMDNDEYQDKLKSLLREGDVRKIDRFVASRVARIAGKSTKAVWANRGFAKGGGTRPAGRAAASGDGVTRPMVLAKKPTADQIDWSKDRSKMRFISGEATLKNGKIVRWDRDAI